MSNLGKWASIYTEKWIARRQSNGRKMGGSLTYLLAAEFFSVGVGRVEDWGGGLGAFRNFLPEWVEYVVVDGTESPYSDRVEDLELYTSQVDGILLRHVLGHNDEWKTILTNAISSFQRNICLIFFTPWSDDETKVISTSKLGRHTIPVISFRRQDVEDCIESFPGVQYRLVENIHSPKSEFKVEHIYYIERA